MFLLLELFLTRFSFNIPLVSRQEVFEQCKVAVNQMYGIEFE